MIRGQNLKINIKLCKIIDWVDLVLDSCMQFDKNIGVGILKISQIIIV